MIYNEQPIENKQLYNQMLKSTGALSNLFSDNDAPYIVSRNVEFAYCEAFGADNLGRSDCSADATLNNVGIGLKTFIHGNGKTLQKIAEFNKDADLYRNKNPKDLINSVSMLRNERIDFTMRTYGLKSMIYHCVTRMPGKILIFETPMVKIDIPNIKNINVCNKNTITFEDGKNEYSFNLTKSTLYKRFITIHPLEEIEVNIIEKPYVALAKLMELMIPKVQTHIFEFPKEIIEKSTTQFIHQNNLDTEFEVPEYNTPNSKQTLASKEYVILPLFSDRGNKRHVPEKSGLNQWNANGRPRHHDEIYIPIPRWIHNVFPTFFPPRDEHFELKLPDKTLISTKVCQDNSKALMSNPNKKLGEWLLRNVLNLQAKDLLTYEYLQVLGIDSVIVYKLSETQFTIDFCEIGSYDIFQSEYNTQQAVE